MQRMNFKTKNQLKRHVYFYIMTFFLVFLIAFLLLANLGRIVVRHNRESVYAEEPRIQAMLARYTLGDVPAMESGAAPVTASGASYPIYLYGDDPIASRLKNHLTMLKQPFEELDELDALERDVSGLVIVATSDLDAGSLAWLLAQNDQGTHLLFATLPPIRLLVLADVRSRLGIKKLGAEQTYPGMRTSKEMMLGTILEYDGSERDEDFLNVTARRFELTQQIKVFAHALPADHLEQNVTDLPPLFWRYAPGNGRGNVYVCNGDFLSDETAYALLPTVLGDLYGSYLYPIVNAYCLMIDGFPYAENKESALWRQLYSRDGYGIQRELLWPEWQRMESKYGTALTYFSPAYNEILSDANDEMQFYHTEFRQGNAELAGQSAERRYLYSPDDPFDLAPLTADFSFIQDGELRLAYQENSWQEPEKTLFRTAGTIRGMGYMGLRVDVAELLELQTDLGLPDFFEQMSTLIGYQSTLYPWLERVTAQEAAERIDAYLRLRPTYSYREDGVSVHLDAFDRQAWFLLKTHGVNPEIDQGSMRKIGENTYLVQVTAPDVEITWKGDGQ